MLTRWVESGSPGCRWAISSTCSGRVVRAAGHTHLADMGLRTSGDGEEDSDLLGLGVLQFLFAERGAVVSVLLEQLLDILDRTIQFVLGEGLSQLQLGGVDDLADARPVRVATDLDFAHKVVGRW